MRRCPACAYEGPEDVCPRDGTTTFADTENAIRTEDILERTGLKREEAEPPEPRETVPRPAPAPASPDPPRSAGDSPEENPIGVQAALSGKRKDRLLGRTLAGRYEIKERIGAGGMGVVYRAYQESMDRMVALKILSKGLTSNDLNIKRFHQEARAASRLRHPNTITLHDFGQTEDGILFIAMEYLDGVSLDRVIRRDKALAPQRAIKIMGQVCRSLDEAHKAGVIHRDLKPDNIFLNQLGEEQDFVKVLDFGVAKLRESKHDSGTLTKAGMIFGTPKYMSPEQAQSLPLDARSDLYSMGVILYEMLRGRAPFEAEAPLSILIKHVHETPPPFPVGPGKPEIPPRLGAAVFRLLSKDMEERHESAGALLEDLTSIAVELQGGRTKGPVGTGLVGLAELGGLDSRPPEQGWAVGKDIPKGPKGEQLATMETASSLGAVAQPTPSDQWAFAVEDPTTPPGTRHRAKVPVTVLGIIAALLIGGAVLFSQNGSEQAERPTAVGAKPAPAAPAPPPPEAKKPPSAPELMAPKAGETTAAAPTKPKKRSGKAKGPKRPGKPKSAKATTTGSVTINLASLPAGASIQDSGGRFVGLAPMTLTRPKSRTTSERFTFKKKGFKDKSHLVLLNADKRITARLQEVGAEEKTTGPRATPARPPTSGPGSPFKAFDDFRRVKKLESD